MNRIQRIAAVERLTSQSRRSFINAALLAEQQRNAEAIEYLRRAIELQPSLAQAHYRLGQLYQRVGRHDLAEKELAVFRELKGKGEDK